MPGPHRRPRPRAAVALLAAVVASGLAGSGLAAGAAPQAPTAERTAAAVATTDWSSVPALREVSPWPVGVAIDQRETTGTGAAVVARHFDQITAENAMKPAYIWRDPTETSWTDWDWAGADAHVDFARARGLRVHGHTLVWHQQMPAWFYARPDGTPYWDAAARRCIDVTDADRDLMRRRITTYVDGVAAHFRSRYGEYGTPGNPIVAFDVVNEAVENTADHHRQVENPLYCVLGTTYVEHALRAADAAFRDADGRRSVLLFLNDFNTEWSWKSDDQLAVLRDLLDRGVPLDGVGHQLHLALADGERVLEEANLPRTLDQVAALGLRQAVTELDVGLAAGLAGTALDGALQEQGELYGDLFALFRRHDLWSVTVWGPHDGRTWRTGTRPLLLDAGWGVKPAFHGASERAPVLTGDLPATLSLEEGGVLTLEVGYDAAPDPTLAWQVRPRAGGLWTTVARDTPTYRLEGRTELDGAQVRVVVTNRRGTTTGRAAAVRVTEPPAPAAVAGPSVAGTAVVGRTLTAAAATWEPAGAVVARQWLRDGIAVPGATGPTYPLGPQDAGARLAVRETAVVAGRPPATATSAASDPVARAASDLRVRARVRPDGRTVLTVRVRSAGLRPSGTATVRVTGRMVRRLVLREGRARVPLPVTATGARRLVVRFGGNDWAGPATVRVRGRR